MRSAILLGIALVVVTLAVYWQVGNHEFVNLDDNWLITNNVHVSTGLSKENFVWAFSPTPGIGWHPIAWLSHMIDVELYGLNPRGHHLTNVAFHAAAALFLLLLLFRTTHALWQSAFVAALFALHPLHVESVAWVAERRDVLSACFGFLSLWLYAEYVLQHRRSFYLLALLAFVLGLMSKPMLVTLPVLMLLLDYWPLNRFAAKRSPGSQHRIINLYVLMPLLKEKLPFVVCSSISVVMTLITPTAKMMITVGEFPLWLKVANSLTSYLNYIIKMFWPINLAVYYPFPSAIPAWQIIVCLLFLIATTTIVIRVRYHYRYLFVGWFWYLTTLVPVLGLIQIGGHSIADRYTYIPLIGLFIVLSWATPELTKSIPYQKVILVVSYFIVISTSTFLTWEQLKHWQNSISLFRHTIRVTSNNALAHNNLGLALAVNGHLDEAILEFKKTLEIDPGYAPALKNLQFTLIEKQLRYKSN